MSARAPTLDTIIRRFAASRRRRILLLSSVRAVCSVVLCVFVIVYLDVLLQPGPATRIAMICVSVILAGFAATFTNFRQTRSRSEARLVARLVEENDPSLRNDLVNALEFERLLTVAPPVPVSRALMWRSVVIAFERAAKLTRVRTLTPKSLRIEVLALLSCLAVAVILGLVFRELCWTVAPRYLDPYGDHPPFSATRLIVDPPGVTVDYDDNVNIRVTTSGVQPEDVLLVLEDAGGAVLSELPMLRNSDGDFRQTIEHAKRDLVYYARIERGRSKRYALSISKTPRIGAVTITYEYPAYTKLPARTRQLGPQSIIRTYEGTRIGLTIESNRPLVGGILRVGDQEMKMVRAGTPQSVMGTFTVDRPAELEARLTDSEGNSSKDVLQAKVELQPDEPPHIAIVSPGRQAYAVPTAQVPLDIEAQDDLGVANVTLYRGLNGSGDSAKILFSSTGGEATANVLETLDLADLGVHPGDVIDFYATVTDTSPTSPHSSATPAYQISIISEDQYQSFLRQETTAADLKAEYATIGRRLEGLGKEQEDIRAQAQALFNVLALGEKLNADALSKVKELARAQAILADRTKAAADELRKDAASPHTFDIEESFTKSLEQMAARLDRARDAMQKSAAALEHTADEDGENDGKTLAHAIDNQDKALDELGHGARQFSQEIEKPLDHLGRMYKLMEDIETFKAIYTGQVDLERHARSFRDVNVPSLDQRVRLKELGEAQREIRDALIDLRDNVEKHAAEIESVLSKAAKDARDIADSIDRRNIPTVMEQAMDGLSSGNGADGHQSAEEAAHLLAEMIQRVSDASGSTAESEERLMIGMGMNPGGTVSQLQSSVRSAFDPRKRPGGADGGASGSSTPFDMFGPEGNKTKAEKQSTMAKRKIRASAEEARDQSEFAGAFEEVIADDESTGPTPDAPAVEPIAEEYRPIIEAYFQRIAEEDR